MITEYTTFDEIRAALGVGPKEISDQTLGLEMWQTHLLEEFEAASPYVLTTFAALPAQDSRTANQLRFARLVGLFATYAVAADLLSSVDLFGFLKVGDGRASTERPTDAFQNLRASVTAMFARVKALLLSVLALLEPAAPAPTTSYLSVVGAAGIAADPVVG